MLTEFEQIKVPKNLVNAAISQGVAQARPVKHRRHVVVGTVLGMAAVGCWQRLRQLRFKLVALCLLINSSLILPQPNQNIGIQR
jgi:glucose uptake protein GlcU